MIWNTSAPSTGPSSQQQKSELEQHLETLLTTQNDESLQNMIIGFLSQDGQLDANEILQFKNTLEEKLEGLPSVSGRTAAEVQALVDTLPRDHESLLAFAIRNNLISLTQYGALMKLAGQRQVAPSEAAPKQVQGQEAVSLTEQQALLNLEQARANLEAYRQSRVQIMKQGRKGYKGQKKTERRANVDASYKQVQELRSQMGDPTAQYWAARNQFEQVSGVDYSDYLRAQRGAGPRPQVVFRDRAPDQDALDLYSPERVEARNRARYMDEITYSRVAAGQHQTRMRLKAKFGPDVFLSDVPASFAIAHGFTEPGMLESSQQSFYRDHTGMDQAYYEGRSGSAYGSGQRQPYGRRDRDGGGRYDQGMNSYIESQGGDAFMRTQNRLRDSYTPGLLQYVEENIDKYRDDPAYPSLRRAYESAKMFWRDDPERVYGDLAIVRSQIVELEKRARRKVANEKQLEAIRESKTQVFKSIDLYPSNGLSFDPGERVIFVLPKGSPGFRGKSDRTIAYEPFTELGAQEDSEWEILKNAGIIIEKQYSDVSTYQTGMDYNRPHVTGLKINFTKPVEVYVNGKAIVIGADGKEVAQSDLENVVASGELSFGRLQPRVIEITGNDGTNIQIDVQNMEIGMTIVRAGAFSITRLSKSNFVLKTNRKGEFTVTGFENESGKGLYTWKIGSPEKQSGGVEKRQETYTEFTRLLTEAFPEIQREHLISLLKELNTKEDYLLDIIDAESSKRASQLQRAAAIKQELSIDLSNFDAAKMDQVASLLYLARAQYTLPVIQVLKKADIHLGLSFEPERKTISLEEDRSSIILVSNKLLQDPRAKSGGSIDSLAVQYWKEIKNLQEKSFTESEELDEAGNPKPIDVFVITEKSLESHRVSRESLIDSFNQYPSQRDANGATKGRASSLVVDDPIRGISSQSDLFQKYAEAQKRSKENGHHLVTFVVLHGMPSGIFLPLKKGSGQYVNIDALSQKTDLSTASLFVSSCFAGEHIVRRSAMGASKDAFKNLATNVSYAVNSIDLNQFEDEVMRRACEKLPDGSFRADLNKDGKVTLAEVRYWMDTHELYNDPMSFDKHGNRITDVQSKEPGQGADNVV